MKSHKEWCNYKESGQCTCNCTAVKMARTKAQKEIKDELKLLVSMMNGVMASNTFIPMSHAKVYRKKLEQIIEG